MVCQSVQAVAYISDPPPRRERRKPVCQVLSTPLGDVQSRAQAGHLQTGPQPLPLHCAAPFAVKCNSGLCGIKTAFIHNQRRSETRTNAGGQEQRAAGGGKRSVSGGAKKHRADSRLCFNFFFTRFCVKAGVHSSYHE